MKVLGLLLCVVALIHQAFASEVVVLTKENFAEKVDPEDLILVEFYAPWCGHCKNLAPEYESAAAALKEDNVKLAKIDCTAETDICEKYKVSGYPTLKVFRNGVESEYRGGRTSDTIVSYMRKQAMPAISEVSDADFQTFIKKDKVVAVAYLPNGKESKEFETVSKIANAHRDDYLFGYSSSAAGFGKNLPSKDKPGVVLFKSFDTPVVVYKGDVSDQDALTQFIKTESIPLMAEISPENYMSYIESGLPLGFFFYEGEESRSKFGPLIEKVAKDFKGKANFVYCDAQKFGAHAETLNLKLQWPAFGVSRSEDGAKWPLDQSKEITESSVRTLVKGILDGSIEPSLKSAPEPADNNGPVKDIVGSTFERDVLDSKKDVLVEFYAPWCGHCKKLAPTWQKLGEAFSGVENVVIAKMDATENDVPPAANTRIEGFPTIKLYKAKDNTVVEYTGDRSLEDLIEFIRTNAVNNEFTLKDVKEDSASTQEEETRDEL